MSTHIVLHYPAIVIATLLAMALGALWYSPILFGPAWMRANGFTADSLKSRGNPAVILGGATVLTLAMALNLAAFLSGPADLEWGAAAGLLAGGGWVALSFGVTYLFERKPLSLFLVNAGYHAISFTAMGALIGVWK